MNVPNLSDYQFTTSTITNNSQPQRRLLCRCGVEAILREVKSPNSRNRGRHFWSCRKFPREDCKYFRWFDIGNDGSSSSMTRNSFSRPEAPNFSTDNNNNGNDNNNSNRVRCYSVGDDGSSSMTQNSFSRPEAPNLSTNNNDNCYNNNS